MAQKMSEKANWIYAIINKENGNRYIGSTVCGLHRWHTHLAKLRGQYHDNSHLQRAFNKYGETSFEFAVLEIVNSDHIRKREQWYLDNTQCEYNLNSFADCPPNQDGNVRSPETRELIRKVRAKQIITDEHKAAISRGLKLSYARGQRGPGVKGKHSWNYNPDPQHGTISTYSNRKCRCSECKAACAASSREYRARKRLVVYG